MPDPKEKLALLKEQFNRLKYQDMFNSMTDNFYYTSGRSENMKKMILEISESIREIDPAWDPYKDPTLKNSWNI